MDLLQFQAQLASEGYQTVTTVRQGAGYQMGEHAHPFDALALILEGDFTITVAGERRHYAAGEVFRLAAGTVHTEHSVGGVVYRAGRRSKE